MYNVQEQEEYDFQIGAASEMQNAYSLSQMQHRSGMQGVRDLVKAGLYVVVLEGPAYCPRTDALMGSCYIVLGAFRYRSAAQAYANLVGSEDLGEGSVDVYPLPLQPRQWQADFNDDIPF